MLLARIIRKMSCWYTLSGIINRVVVFRLENGGNTFCCPFVKQQTDWNANEAVNLVIATPPEDLLPATMISANLGRRGASTRASFREPAEPSSVVGDETPDWSAVNLAMEAPEQPATSSSFMNFAATVAHYIDEALLVSLTSDLFNSLSFVM